MLNEIVLIIFYVTILLYSVIIHEVFHGVAALWLGDPTAKYSGRLKLSPQSHIDPMGTIFIPFLVLLMTNFKFAFGWAKPVPYNPYNLKNQRWGPAAVAAAVPGINLAIAFVAAVIAKLLPVLSEARKDIFANFQIAVFSDASMAERWGGLALSISQSWSHIVFSLLLIVIFWNVLLAVFNLLPIPPLDGSKLLFSVVKIKMETVILLEQFGFLLLIAIIILDAMTFNLISNFLRLTWSFFYAIAVY